MKERSKVSHLIYGLLIYLKTGSYAIIEEGRSLCFLLPVHIGHVVTVSRLPKSMASSDNPIGRLNEYATRHGLKVIDQYEQDGPAHNRTFICTMKMGEHTGIGNGKTKKEAKANAATDLLSRVQGSLVSRGSGLDEGQFSGVPLSGFGISLEPVGTTIPLYGATTSVGQNNKNKLQEMCQKKGLPIPKYEMLNRTGPSHQLEHTVRGRIYRIDNTTVIAQQTSTAKTIKAAEMDAAGKLIEDLECLVKTTGFGMPFPVLEISEDETDGSSSLKQTSIQTSKTIPVGSTSPGAPNIKGQLQELCQQNLLLIPIYKTIGVKGQSHDREFTIKCTVQDRNGDVLEETYGNGKSKRTAEVDAATKLYNKLKPLIDSLPSGGVMPHNPHRPMKSESTQLEEDPLNLDELVARVVYKDCNVPEYLIEKSEPADKKDPSTSKYLCLAYTKHQNLDSVVAKQCRYDIKERPLVGHGTGYTESDAKCEAVMNLLHTINVLGL